MSSDKQLHAQLARYMDAKAFEAVKVGKEQAEKLKVRREIATKRARTAVRFFLKPDNLSRLTAQASLASTPTPPTLATVAAANDEGVAEAAKVADDYAAEFKGKADCARDTGERRIFEAHHFAGKKLAAAIRLLSQGGGK